RRRTSRNTPLQAQVPGRACLPPSRALRPSPPAPRLQPRDVSSPAPGRLSRRQHTIFRRLGCHRPATLKRHSVVIGTVTRPHAVAHAWCERRLLTRAELRPAELQPASLAPAPPLSMRLRGSTQCCPLDVALTRTFALRSRPMLPTARKLAFTDVSVIDLAPVW